MGTSPIRAQIALLACVAVQNRVLLGSDRYIDNLLSSSPAVFRDIRDFLSLRALAENPLPSFVCFYGDT